MTKAKSANKLSTHNLHYLFDKWSPIIVAFSTIIIIFATLFPFNFSPKLISEITNLTYAFRHQTNFHDVVNNILLFIPFGFGLSAVLKKYIKSIIGLILITFLASAGLSFTVEFLQILLPSRSTTVADIVNNSMGGLVGFLCFHIWKYRIINSIWQLIEVIRNSLSIKNLIVVGIVYTIFCLIIAANLPRFTSLRNWNPQFYLYVGNEKTGDRSWQGYISQLAIANRNISQQEIANAFAQNKLLSDNDPALIAAYKFIDQGNLIDTTGNSPTLSWQGKSEQTEDNSGVFVSSHHWLKTSSPATSITEKIRHSSQFTLSTTFATNQISQTGPARIISISRDHYQRNFTLGQNGSDLVFRLRTRITGRNGTNPQIVFPNVLNNNRIHHLIITYNGSILKFYIDNLSNIYTFNLHPGFAFFNILAFVGNPWDIYANSSYQLIYNVLYYIFTFIPLGIILGLLTNLVRPKIIFYIVLMPVFISLPPILLETVLSNQSGDNWQWKNMILAMAITLIGMIGTNYLHRIKLRTQRQG